MKITLNEFFALANKAIESANDIKDGVITPKKTPAAILINEWLKTDAENGFKQEKKLMRRINVMHCSTDKKGNVLQGEKGELLFTPENLIKRDEAIEELGKSIIEIEIPGEVLSLK